MLTCSCLRFTAHVIAKAKGLAILSVIKAGFLVTARGGSGVVLARLPDGSKLIIFVLDTFGREHDRFPHAPNVVILECALWMSRQQGQPAFPFLLLLAC